MRFDETTKELEISPSADVIFCPFAYPGKTLANELEYYKKPFNVEYPKQGALAKPWSTVYIWGHGNYKDRVATDPKKRVNAQTGLKVSPAVETLGGRQLAAVLQASGLPSGFDGDLVVWTCWGGVPGGLAQALLLSLRNKGFNNPRLKVWGARYMTGPIRNGYPLIYKLPQWRVFGDDDVLPFGTGMALTSSTPTPQDWTGTKRKHLLCY
jgi:hypothetical protein